MIINNLALALSFYAQLKSSSPNSFKILKVVRKALKHLVKQLLSNKTFLPQSKTIKHLWHLALLIDFLATIYPPCTIPQEAPLYPLFSLATDMLKFKGVFNILGFKTPPSKKALSPNISTLAITLRLVVRVAHASRCNWAISPPTRDMLALVSSQQTEALNQLAQNQEKELRLASEATDTSQENSEIIEVVNGLSLENHKLAQQIRAFLTDPSQKEIFLMLFAQQKEITAANNLVKQLKHRLDVLNANLERELNSTRALAENLKERFQYG